MWMEPHSLTQFTVQVCLPYSHAHVSCLYIRATNNAIGVAVTLQLQLFAIRNINLYNL